MKDVFRFRSLMAGIAAAVAASAVLAAEGPVPKGVAPLDHVFLIMMENHAYGQVVGNPNMPLFNSYLNRVNVATNYFAVGHPSLTNYLEIVGGSNFGVRDDNSPDWHSSSCQTNLSTGQPSLESTAAAICPIAGKGTDAATPAFDCTNEPDPAGDPTTNVGCDIDVDGKVAFPAVTNTTAKTIADQLVERGLSWKAYEESLPPTGADGVNNADGLFSNLNLSADPPLAGQEPTSNFSIPVLGGDETGTVNGKLAALYAVKHNPFAYFANVQAGTESNNSLNNVVGYGGHHGLFSDLARGELPSLVYIVPNQCHDQHGRDGAVAGPECAFDPNDIGTLDGLNPALMYEGDQALEQLIIAIKSSPVWGRGRNAIVIVWDENDYSVNPTTNQVVLSVDTNDQDGYGIKSDAFYTHFSLLKSMEAAFGLPCLNHACDRSTAVMADLFRRH